MNALAIVPFKCLFQPELNLVESFLFIALVVGSRQKRENPIKITATSNDRKQPKTNIALSGNMLKSNM